MTKSDLSRSGLDMPEGSANADQVEETGLVDTNADSHRNPAGSTPGTPSDPGDSSGDGEGDPVTPTDPDAPVTPGEPGEPEQPEQQPAQQQ
jgi:hypothetical protein